MVAIIFTDLSVTLHVERGYVPRDMTLRTVINEFTDKWCVEKITVRGRPIKPVELGYPVEDLARENYVTGDMVLEIEKH